jgi:hypothetical protein
MKGLGGKIWAKALDVMNEKWCYLNLGSISGILLTAVISTGSGSVSCCLVSMSDRSHETIITCISEYRRRLDW